MFNFIEGVIARIVVRVLAPCIAKNCADGIEEFNKHYFPVPVRCKAKHWMRRGEKRVDIAALFDFEEVELSER